MYKPLAYFLSTTVLNDSGSTQEQKIEIGPFICRFLNRLE